MKSKQEASTMVAVMISITMFSALLSVIVSVTKTQSGNTQRTIMRSQAQAYGDAVLESLYDQWRNSMITATDATDRLNGRSTSAVEAMIAPPTTSQLPPPRGIALADWSVTAATPMLEPTTRADGRPVPEQGTGSRLRMRLYYLGRAEVTMTTSRGVETVVVERPFIRGGRNLFDNFLFATQQETEIHPGAPMYVDGTVYIGGNLYTAHNDIHFMTDTTFLGTHSLGYHIDDERNSQTINNGGLGDNWDLDNPPRKGVEQKLFDTKTELLEQRFLDHANSNDTNVDGNPNNDGYHELIETPSGTGTDPLKLDDSTSERLSQNADYRIFVDVNNNVQIYKGNSATPLSTTNAEYIALKDTLTLNTAMKDIREGDNTRIVTMDIEKLRVAADGSTKKIFDNFGSDDGFLIYMMDTSAGTSVSTKVVNSATGATTNVTSARRRGFKLINGGKLPSKGLTLASPNIVYIQGDYNTGKSGTTQPASNTTGTYTPPVNKPSPVVTGYNRVPAAVAADAVNILSNAWNDANSLLSKTNRVASNTTVNTAIIAGNVPSLRGSSGSYSGGIENFVRFHENWSGKYFTIYGTLAALYNSNQALGQWKVADYNPPNRRWYYDTNLQDSNPPGFRIARVYERGRWTVR